MNSTSLLVDILTGIVAFAVCIPVFGSLIRNKERRLVGLGLALVIGIAAGVIAGRLVGRETEALPAPQEGGTTPASESRP